MQTAPALGLRMDAGHLAILPLLAGLALFAALRCIAMPAGAAVKPKEE